MKHSFLILLFVLTGIAVSAQDNKEDYSVRVVKSDGTVFDGYNETKFSDHLRPYVTNVSISREFKGKLIKYSGNEVKRIEFTGATPDSLPLIFDAVIPQTTLPNYFNKNPKPYKELVFFRLVYDGENVKGYAMPYIDLTMVPGRHTVIYT